VGRNPYPPGYRTAFACSLLLCPQSCRHTSRWAFPRGRATGLPRSAFVPGRVRSCPAADGASSARGVRAAPVPGRGPFWFKPVSTFGSFNFTAVQLALHLQLTIPSAPGSRPPGCWQSRHRLTPSTPLPKERGDVVPQAPHLSVTRDARCGRRRLAEHPARSRRFPSDLRAEQLRTRPRVAPPGSRHPARARVVSLGPRERYEPNWAGEPVWPQISIPAWLLNKTRANLSKASS
jgi:hypothetical protein